jgi:hypothetical protein
VPQKWFAPRNENFLKNNYNNVDKMATIYGKNSLRETASYQQENKDTPIGDSTASCRLVKPTLHVRWI